jgi:hypothetical protein
MAKTITQLPDATTVGESDEMIVQQSGITKRATIGELKAQVATLGARDITVSGANRSITNTGNFALSFGTNNTEQARISNAGNVGIATTSPDAKLKVHGNIATDQTAGRFLGFGVGTFSFDSTTAADYGLSYTAPSGEANTVCAAFTNIKFCTNQIERMRVTSGGNVGVGTTSPNAAALLDVSSTTKGFLPPRMTTAERDAITSPPAGLMIYNTSTNKLNVRTASSWEAVTSA